MMPEREQGRANTPGGYRYRERRRPLAEAPLLIRLTAKELDQERPPMLRVSFMWRSFGRSAPWTGAPRRATAHQADGDQHRKADDEGDQGEAPLQVSMTARMAIVWIRLVMMLVMVLLIAFWAPITSLFSRLINSPTGYW